MDHKHEPSNEKEGVPIFTGGKYRCDEECGHKHHHHGHRGGPAGAVYGLGFIGALVYYLSTAATFWIGVLGILKAMVWPAFLIYELMKFLHM